jgi:hypothetical protein
LGIRLASNFPKSSKKPKYLLPKIQLEYKNILSTIQTFILISVPLKMSLKVTQNKKNRISALSFLGKLLAVRDNW